MRAAKKLFDQAGETLEARGKDYGEAETLFANVAKRWSLTFGTEVSADQVALCLIELKLARLNANPKHRDSLVDVVGYAGILDALNGASGNGFNFDSRFAAR